VPECSPQDPPPAPPYSQLLSARTVGIIRTHIFIDPLAPLTPIGCSKNQTSHPQPWRLFHPPALSLPNRLFALDAPCPKQGRSELSLLRGAGMIPTARNIHPPRPQRAKTRFIRARAFQFPIPPLEEWPRLPSTARIERAQFHRARSASKEGTWPLLPHPSEAARARARDRPSYPAPFSHSAIEHGARRSIGRSGSSGKLTSVGLPVQRCVRQ